MKNWSRQGGELAPRVATWDCGTNSESRCPLHAPSCSTWRGCLIPQRRRKVERPPPKLLPRRVPESISPASSLPPSLPSFRSVLPFFHFTRSVDFFRKLRQNKSYILLVLPPEPPFLLPTDCRVQTEGSLPFCLLGLHLRRLRRPCAKC